MSAVSVGAGIDPAVDAFFVRADGFLRLALRAEERGDALSVAHWRMRAEVELVTPDEAIHQHPDCVCEQCVEPAVYDQDAQDVSGYVTDDYDGLWQRIKAWLGFQS